MESVAPKHIVIIGGGFAGLNLIKQVANDPRFIITLIDKNNYNQFTPLVYQVATGFLEPSNISYPFRKYLRKKRNIRFKWGDLSSISPEEHRITLGSEVLHYDYLVLATGSISNFFGNKDLEDKAIALKTLADALNMRNRMIQVLEKASETSDPQARAEILTIVIAGAGPTGVEVAGMLGEMRAKIINKDYPSLDLSGSKIYLVDGTDAVLNQMSTKSGDDATKTLENLGIKIILKAFIISFENGTVRLSTGQEIKSRSLIWAAGVTGKALSGIPAGSYGKNKRILVDCYSAVLGLSDVYAIGDNCIMTTDDKFPIGHPQLAQPAIQQGTHLGKNLALMAAGKPLLPFTYTDRGVMAVIGKNDAVVDLTRPRMHLNHKIGLFVWLFIHVHSLISWSGKFKILSNWIITYITGDQSLRIAINSQLSEKEETAQTTKENKNEG